jgi:hypothetical protein
VAAKKRKIGTPSKSHPEANTGLDQDQGVHHPTTKMLAETRTEMISHGNFHNVEKLKTYNLF